jgi:hypothetical protein
MHPHDEGYHCRRLTAHVDAAHLSPPWLVSVKTLEATALATVVAMSGSWGQERSVVQNRGSVDPASGRHLERWGLPTQLEVVFDDLAPRVTDGAVR